MAKTISICIPSYNSEKYVRTTIESVLGQTVPADEFIISDDRSPDRSWEIVKEYESVPGVRVTRPPRRMTLGEHYRFLLEEATSDYVCFLSSDDALMPDFIETMQQVLAAEENIGLISSACLETTGTLKPVRVRDTERPKQSLPPPEGFRYLLNGCLYTVSVSLFAREMLLKAPIIPPDADLATDWCWALWVTMQAKLKFVTRPVGYYRIHTSNAGHNNNKWERATFAMRDWFKAYLPDDLGRELISHMNLPSEEPAARPKWNAVAEAKRSAKWILALPYRSLPAHLKAAEMGKSWTLQRMGMQYQVQAIPPEAE